MGGCGRTSAPWRPSTMPSPPSTRPHGSRARRSSAFAREASAHPSARTTDRRDVRMTDPTGPGRCALDDPHTPGFEFEVANDEKNGVYEAIVGDQEIAGLPYNVAGKNRVVLLATSVLPEFRRRGIG